MTSLTYSSGSVSYVYDKLGRLAQRSVSVAGTPVTTSYGYVDGGQGTNSTTGLIQTITQNGVTLTYAYDDRGNITSVSDGTKTTSYEYDAIGQLIRVNDETDTTAGSTGTTWLFSYDLGGNILTKAAYPFTTGTVGTATVTHTYTYGNAGWKDQLTARDGVTIQYDAIGNPTNDGTWQYTWQHGKQLASMTRIVGNETVSFEYNEDGLRTKKTVTNGEGTVVTEYMLHGKNIVHMTRGTDEMHFFYGADDKPAIVVFNGTSYRYLYTLQGDVIGLVDGNGAWVVSYRFDAWGKPLGIGGSLASTLGVLQPFRYRGYVFDPETGDYYLRSRHYRAEWCRFISADALVDENLFEYCESNPVTSIDEDGFYGNGTIHSQVCSAIEESSDGELHRNHVKILGIPNKAYGYCDIWSEDGYVWEVKRATCPVIPTLRQLDGYISGIWLYGIESNKPYGGHLKRGDDRPIFGSFEYQGYSVTYRNIGNGIILYDYHRISQRVEESYVQDRITQKATQYSAQASRSAVSSQREPQGNMAMMALGFIAVLSVFTFFSCGSPLMNMKD